MTLSKILFRLSAVAIGIVFGLIVGFVLYAMIASPQAQQKSIEKVPIWIEGSFPLRDDPEIGFVARESSACFRHEATGLNYHLFTDGRGARENFTSKSRPIHSDVITIGCSFSWGVGFENEFTYSTLIERKTGLSVENFSMGSYGTVQSYLMLRRNLDLHPKYVIYGWIDDHLNRNISPCAPNYIPVCAATAYVSVANLQIMPPVRPDSIVKNQQFYEAIRGGHPGIPDTISWSQKASAADKLVVARNILAKMKKETDSIGTRLIVVDLSQVSSGKLANSTVKDLIPPGVTFIDMTPIAADWPNKARLHFRRDGHPSVLAHKLIASELVRLLN
jgi:hypothetical protein